jgi:hypothetical protein
MYIREEVCACFNSRTIEWISVKAVIGDLNEKLPDKFNYTGCRRGT